MPSPSSRPGRRPDPTRSQCWQQLLNRFRDSGLTVTDFCDRECISTASFNVWRRRLQDAPASPADDTPRHVPVHIVTPPTSAPVELLLPSGVVLRLSPDTDPAWLRQMLSLLGVGPC
jgi:hypothetical protein